MLVKFGSVFHNNCQLKHSITFQPLPALFTIFHPFNLFPEHPILDRSYLVQRSAYHRKRAISIIDRAACKYQPRRRQHATASAPLQSITTKVVRTASKCQSSFLINLLNWCFSFPTYPPLHFQLNIPLPELKTYNKLPVILTPYVLSSLSQNPSFSFDFDKSKQI